MQSRRLFSFLILSCVSLAGAFASVDIQWRGDSRIVELAVEKLAETIEGLQIDSPLPIVLLNTSSQADEVAKAAPKIEVLPSEGFQILCAEKALYVIGGDDKGLRYGILDLRDQLRLKPKLADVQAKRETPRFPFRAIKFNLPWSSYRQGESLQLHMKTVKDTLFWESFLDMMADNRFNVLTLWNLHPFTFMIQPKAFPEATQFEGKEFADWQRFWKTLFRMAKERGIDTYIVNWNIIVSPGMTQAHNVANYKHDLEWHYGFTPADTSQIIVDYMRECITQVINEYPDLTGVGVSVGERMKMPVKDAMRWIEKTFVEGIRNADRPAKFIHRAPFKIAPQEAREIIESYTDFETPIIMEFKFNWSHSHSSPYLSITHGGRIKDQYWNPAPTTYQMAWMMRNEDFLMLNWGNADFIREHIAVNGQSFVAGYFVGSETYIPAKEYRIKPGVAYDWQYAFEKQWAFYQLWGRLLYNPELPDSFFTDQFAFRYGPDVGPKLFEALTLGSRMPLALASFYQGTWDFTLYCEGFLNGKQIYRTYKEATKAFINVEEMITHPTLDPRYLNISEYTDRTIRDEAILAEEITPVELANEMEANGQRILQICADIDALSDQSLANAQIERHDVEAWAHLSLYFAEKLRGGIALDEAIKTGKSDSRQLAVQHLKRAAVHWDHLVETTQAQYQEVSLLHIKTTKFSWEMFRSQVWRDVEIAEGMD